MFVNSFGYIHFGGDIRNITILLLLSLLTIGWGQDCDEGYTEIDGECYYQSDLDVLQQFIDNSQDGENPPPSDLSPIELGGQEWQDGRLVSFCHGEWSGNGCVEENILSGEIPDNIGNLTNLAFLYLSQNSLLGEIPPEIGNLTYLTKLYLDHNQLTGEIPPEIGNLTNLTYLHLGSNNLTSIPSEIGELTNLTFLLLSANNLTSIPSEIGELVNLQTLSFNVNTITEVPTALWNMISLTNLNLGWNQLSGEIPPEIGDLVNLTQLSLHYNQFTEIPPEIGNLTNLTYLTIMSNDLSGEIPVEIGNLTNLNYLNLFGNDLSGEIPESICNLTNLQWSSEWASNYSNIYNNQLCPPYPECLIDQELFTDENNNGIWDEGESFEDTNENGVYEEDYVGEQDTSGCEELSCDEETEVELWGECYNIEETTLLNPPSYSTNGQVIPEEIGQLINLTQINLSFKWLIGNIPVEIGDLTNLNYLDLSINQLTGSIPPEIGNLINLTSLSLGSNILSSPIPPEIGNLTNLNNLYLDYNQLTGELPVEIVNLTNLSLLRLEGNQLTGEIPVEIIGALTNLNYLDLSSNELTGSIPPEIGNLTNLNNLYLNSNQLTGEIPEEICDLGDSLPSLHNNQLCPPYPECIEDYVGYQDTSECPIYGCTDPNAYNYNPDANVDDGSCDFYSSDILIGNWSGEMTEYGAEDLWQFPAILSIDSVMINTNNVVAGDVIGSIKYPFYDWDESDELLNNGCSGELQYFADSLGRFIFIENYTQGTELCNVYGLVEVTILDSMSLQYDWQQIDNWNWDFPPWDNWGFGAVYSLAMLDKCNDLIDCQGECGGNDFDTCSGCQDETASNYDWGAVMDDGGCIYESCLDLHEGYNLISFSTLPTNGLDDFPDCINLIIGEGESAVYDDYWIGSLMELSCEDGYWVFNQCDDFTWCYNGMECSDSISYSLHEGHNLISYPLPVDGSIDDVLPDDIEDCIDAIIGEGESAVNTGNGWAGSLTVLGTDKGYWFTSLCDIDFTFEEPASLSRRQVLSSSPYPYNQSPQQAFYFIESVENIEIGDWILAYNGDIVIGARQWQGNIIDVPAMGDNGSDFTKGYIQAGSIPTFKLLSGDKLIDLTGEIPAWSQNQLSMVSRLTSLPDSFSLSAAYPNPFNPVTTLRFGLPLEAQVSLTIYNLQGRQVVSLIDGNMDAGYHSVIWYADSHASGVYFVKMTAGNYISTQKLMLVK